MEILKQQYNMVKGAREAMFSYLDTIPFALLQQPLGTYSNKSICYLLAHVASVYVHWLVNFAQGKTRDLFIEDELKNMNDVRIIYKTVNAEAENFLKNFPTVQIPVQQFLQNRNGILSTNVLELFTHAITHEFHHKGQVLNMSRQLGFTPVDTDIIRH